jgi:hypothetical protein
MEVCSHDYKQLIKVLISRRSWPMRIYSSSKEINDRAASNFHKPSLTECDGLVVSRLTSQWYALKCHCRLVVDEWSSMSPSMDVSWSSVSVFSKLSMPQRADRALHVHSLFEICFNIFENVKQKCFVYIFMFYMFTKSFKKTTFKMIYIKMINFGTPSMPDYRAITYFETNFDF